MIDELEWKTRRDRINTKLKALNPAMCEMRGTSLAGYPISIPNVPGITKKDRPLTPRHLAEFETCSCDFLPLIRHYADRKQEHLTDRASSIIIAHNHPAGDLVPSKEDIEIAKQLKFAGEVLGIRVLDHMIFNQKDYYSFMEHNTL